MNGKALSLSKRRRILKEIQIGRDHRPKKIAARYGIHQYTVYRLWRERSKITWGSL
jgi:DNA-binding CsgD family transcriptional regulator